MKKDVVVPEDVHAEVELDRLRRKLKETNEKLGDLVESLLVNGDLEKNPQIRSGTLEMLRTRLRNGYQIMDEYHNRGARLQDLFPSAAHDLKRLLDLVELGKWSDDEQHWRTEKG